MNKHRENEASVCVRERERERATPCAINLVSHNITMWNIEGYSRIIQQERYNYFSFEHVFARNEHV